jgi:hypothetical protein
MFHMGYVINNYSTQGMFQTQLYGGDNSVSSPSQNCQWVYPTSSNKQQQQGVGEHNSIPCGSRVLCAQLGGPDGSLVAVGTLGRQGSSQGGGGGIGGSYDTATCASSDVNMAQTDWCVDCQNAGTLNGTRAMLQDPSSQYSKAAGGNPVQFQSSFPTTPYWTNGQG